MTVVKGYVRKKSPVRMGWGLLLILFMLHSTPAEECTETESKHFMERVLKRDISFVRYDRIGSCIVRFADSSR
jgi:hypothetical protein